MPSNYLEYDYSLLMTVDSQERVVATGTEVESSEAELKALAIRSYLYEQGMSDRFPELEPSFRLEVIASRDAPLFRNVYYCGDCDIDWDDVWHAECDDRCPDCDVSIIPTKSIPL